MTRGVRHTVAGRVGLSIAAGLLAAAAGHTQALTGDISITAHCGDGNRGVLSSAGCVELSFDQKLARAYAICIRSEYQRSVQAFIASTKPGGQLPHEASTADLVCGRIETVWGNSTNDDPAKDRAFVEDVAKHLDAK